MRLLKVAVSKALVPIAAIAAPTAANNEAKTMLKREFPVGLSETHVSTQRAIGRYIIYAHS